MAAVRPSQARSLGGRGRLEERSAQAAALAPRFLRSCTSAASWEKPQPLPMPALPLPLTAHRRSPPRLLAAQDCSWAPFPTQQNFVFSPCPCRCTRAGRRWGWSAFAAAPRPPAARGARAGRWAQAASWPTFASKTGWGGSRARGRALLSRHVGSSTSGARPCTPPTACPPTACLPSFPSYPPTLPSAANAANAGPRRGAPAALVSCWRQRNARQQRRERRRRPAAAVPRRPQRAPSAPPARSSPLPAPHAAARLRRWQAR